jgi:hypothetical protein
MARTSRLDGIFKSPKSKLEAKADTTTRAVREITAQESAENAAKTKRLRAARLTRDVDTEAAATESQADRKTR